MLKCQYVITHYHTLPSRLVARKIVQWSGGWWHTFTGDTKDNGRSDWLLVLKGKPPSVDLSTEQSTTNLAVISFSVVDAGDSLVHLSTLSWPASLGNPNWLALVNGNDLVEIIPKDALSIVDRVSLTKRLSVHSFKLTFDRITHVDS